ncbi:MAG: LysM peptidoglycan-binding domain-containing protein, partial [Gammaproteobacteria bacterium]
MSARAAVLALALILAAGCGAPVYHMVRPGETLYSISFRYGKDYRQMAQWNDLAEPYQVNAGQYLRIIPPRREAFAARPPAPAAPAPQAAPAAAAPSGGGVEVYGLNEVPRSAPAPANAPVETAPPPVAAAASGWQWPTARVPARSAVTSGTANRGIDIPGERGEAVRAAAAGRVVYSGNGIPHYGNLLIVKH